jgi:hypothetical protein
MKKKKRGAQPENQNASKNKPGKKYKAYYPVKYWGKRWDMPTGKAIKAYLDAHKQSQADFISHQVETTVILERKVEHGRD